MAGRNLLLDGNGVLKIADFGLARNVNGRENGEYEMSDESNGTAWRWTAPEGILNHIFTIKSDVWSYGMTLAEMCQYGAKPWSVKPAKFKIPSQIIHWVEGDDGKMHDIQEHWPPVLKIACCL